MAQGLYRQERRKKEQDRRRAAGSLKNHMERFYDEDPEDED